MSRFLTNDEELGSSYLDDRIGSKRSLQAPGPSSKRQSIYNERESSQMEKDLKRQSLVSPNSEELQTLFKIFNDATPEPKIIADPRKLNNTEDLRKMVKKIDKLLKETEFRALSFREIRYINSRDFKDIFMHLLQYVYPGYKFKQKFEEEVPLVLKFIGYPSVESFNPKMFYSIAPHLYYLFLNLLDFMADNARGAIQDALAKEEKDKEKTDTHLFEGEKDIKIDDMAKLYFDFTTRCYQHHLLNQPIEPVVDDLEKIFDGANKALEIKRDEMTEQLTFRQEESKTFRETDENTRQLEKRYNDLISDEEKFIEYCRMKKARIDKYTTLNTRIVEEMEGLKRKSDDIMKQVSEAKERLAARGLSLEEMKRLSDDIDQFEMDYANLKIKMDQSIQKAKQGQQTADQIHEELKADYIKVRDLLKASKITPDNHIYIQSVDLFDVYDDDKISEAASKLSVNTKVLVNDWVAQCNAEKDLAAERLLKLKTEIIDKKEHLAEGEKIHLSVKQNSDTLKHQVDEANRMVAVKNDKYNKETVEKEHKLATLKANGAASLKDHEHELAELNRRLDEFKFDAGVREKKWMKGIETQMEAVKQLKIKVDKLAVENEHFSDEALENISVTYSQINSTLK